LDWQTSKIAFIAQPEYFRFAYGDWLNSPFETREFPFKYDMGENDFDDLMRFDADVNFFFRGEFFPRAILERLRGLKIALSSEPFPRKLDGRWEYTLDSIRRYLAFRSARARKFDYVFHYDKCSLPLFEKDGLSVSGEFVLPVSLKTYRHEHKEKRWDLFFIGRSTVHRERLFLRLKHKFNFLHIAHGIWGEGLVDLVNSSRICLNVHAEKEISWEPRVQMMLACGAFVLSEKLSPNEYLRTGTDYIEFSNGKDLAEKVDFYLAHDEARAAIVRNARCRIHQFFDSEKRFSDLMESIGRGRYKNFGASPNGAFLIEMLEKASILSKIFRK
jgi:Glycosyl transferases group 1